MSIHLLEMWLCYLVKLGMMLWLESTTHTTSVLISVVMGFVVHHCGAAPHLQLSYSHPQLRNLS